MQASAKPKTVWAKAVNNEKRRGSHKKTNKRQKNTKPQIPQSKQKVQDITSDQLALSDQTCRSKITLTTKKEQQQRESAKQGNVKSKSTMNQHRK